MGRDIIRFYDFTL